MKHDDDHVHRAVDSLKDKVTYGSAKTGFVTYSELFKSTGLPLPENIYARGDSGFANRFMEDVLWHCRDDGLPPLDALVILKAGGQPSGGYFPAWAKLDPLAKSDPLAFWSKQVEECLAWGKEEKVGDVIGYSDRDAVNQLNVSAPWKNGDVLTDWSNQREKVTNMAERANWKQRGVVYLGGSHDGMIADTFPVLESINLSRDIVGEEVIELYERTSEAHDGRTVYRYVTARPDLLDEPE